MKKILYIVAIVSVLISCKTYTVTPESFREQLLKGDTPGNVTINNPFGGTITYNANSLKSINVVAKNGSEITLDNSPSLEMRVTLANGKRRIMYFDTVTLKNDTLYADGSRFLDLERKIALNSVVKIEIQDGGKKYKYQQ